MNERRENGLSPELRGDRSVHALMEVSSSSSEMKSEYPEENVQNMKNMIGVCASSYENKKNGEAASINVEGCVAEVLRKGGAAICEDAEGNVESAMLLKAAAKEKFEYEIEKYEHGIAEYKGSDDSASGNGKDWSCHGVAKDDEKVWSQIMDLYKKCRDHRARQCDAVMSNMPSWASICSEESEISSDGEEFQRKVEFSRRKNTHFARRSRKKTAEERQAEFDELMEKEFEILKRKNMIEAAKARIAKVKMKKKIRRMKKQRKNKEYLQRDELVSYPVQ